ncbi:UNVERIFIED_CONTAM: hypothetical protein GTU68_004319 [Idotea baltica]|nr:hypothetical protein [Idotea baltica]
MMEHKKRSILLKRFWTRGFVMGKLNIILNGKDMERMTTHGNLKPTWIALT